MQESGEPSHTTSWVMEQGIFLLLIDEGFFLFFFFFKIGLTKLPWSGSHSWGESISVINWLGMTMAIPQTEQGNTGWWAVGTWGRAVHPEMVGEPLSLC